MADAPPFQKTPADLKSRLKASYDAIAETYNKWTTEHSNIRVRYLSKFLDLLPSDTSQPLRILELGCGAGEPATRVLASRPNVHVIGNDLSSSQVSSAQANAAKWELGEGSSVEFIEGDMADVKVLDFEKGSLDGVVALYSFIHLPRDEQTLMMERISGWLKEGGLLMGNFSEGEMEGLVMEKWLDEKGWMFWSGWGREGTVERVKGKGFEIVVDSIEGEGVDVEFLWIVARKK